MTPTLTIERPAPLEAARPRPFGPIVLEPGHDRGPARLAAFVAALGDAGVVPW